MRTQIASKVRFALFAAVLAIVAQPAVKAQMPLGTAAVANIPFDFQIGSHYYAAGKYTVHMDNPFFLRIEGASSSAYLMAHSEITRKASPKSELVFDRFGSHYFLRQVHVKGSEDYIASPESKEEKRARTEQLALNQGTPSAADSTTAVALVSDAR